MPEEKLASFENLDAFLEAEREILIAGKLDRLAEMLPRKEALIGALHQVENPDKDAWQRLDKKVRRNQSLLDNAMEGIRTVSRRLASLRRVRNSLETYDSQGRKQRVEMKSGSSIEKRA